MFEVRRAKSRERVIARFQTFEEVCGFLAKDALGEYELTYAGEELPALLQKKLVLWRAELVARRRAMLNHPSSNVTDISEYLFSRDED